MAWPCREQNGFPLRLIAPGWYGIANAKWLKRIEVRDTRFMSQLMGRDYVTIREEDHDGETGMGGDFGRPRAAEIGAGAGDPQGSARTTGSLVRHGARRSTAWR